MRTTITGICLAGALATQVSARPVSYEGGWTAMQQTDRESSSLHVHYTPHHKWSLGYRAEWDSEEDTLFQGLQVNYLANRWFGEDYQANVYLMGGLGIAEGVDDNPQDPGAASFAGIMADWETRRWFLGYHGHVATTEFDDATAFQSARLGVAPYIGEFGDLHTWLMVEVDQRPENEEPLGVTPLVRFFKGPMLVEFGYSMTDDKPLFNFVYRF